MLSTIPRDSVDKVPTGSSPSVLKAIHIIRAYLNKATLQLRRKKKHYFAQMNTVEEKYFLYQYCISILVSYMFQSFSAHST